MIIRSSFPLNWYYEDDTWFNDPITDVVISPDECEISGGCINSFLVMLRVTDKGCYTAEECADKMPYSAICSVSTGRKTITIDQFSAIEQYEYPEEDCGTSAVYQKVVYWIKDNKLYTLQGLDDFEEEYQQHADTFEKIKNSIKFQ